MCANAGSSTDRDNGTLRLVDERQRPGGQALEVGQGLQVLSDDARAGGDRGRARARHGQSDDVGQQAAPIGALRDVGGAARTWIAGAERSVGQSRQSPLVVHRYESLSLLNQVVFAKDRPKSRLAREYAQISNRILNGNLADREGALHYVRENRRGFERARLSYPGTIPRVQADTLKQIADSHGSDGEVLYQLGTLAAESEFEQARSMFTRAMDAGYRTPAVYLARAEVRSDEGDADGASEDAMRVLDFDQLPVHIVHRAVRLATSRDAQGIESSPALLSLEADEQLFVASRLERQGEPALSAAIVARLAEDIDGSDESRARARSQLALAHIESGEFPNAQEILSRGGRGVGSMAIQDAFNYGMAEWAEVGHVSVPPFQRVVELAKDPSDERSGANYMQCLAIAHWAVGDQAAATASVNRAREEARAEGGLVFSCWQYRSVRMEIFLEDLDEICALIEGDETRVPKIRGFGARTA